MDHECTIANKALLVVLLASVYASSTSCKGHATNAIEKAFDSPDGTMYASTVKSGGGAVGGWGTDVYVHCKKSNSSVRVLRVAETEVYDVSWANVNEAILVTSKPVRAKRDLVESATLPGCGPVFLRVSDSKNKE